jgi:hypothetical protein
MATRLARNHTGDGMRRTLVMGCALAAVSVLGTIVVVWGWVWTVAAWFGASAATFAVATARASRAASAGERRERMLVEHGGAPQDSGIDAAAPEAAAAKRRARSRSAPDAPPGPDQAGGHLRRSAPYGTRRSDRHGPARR